MHFDLKQKVRGKLVEMQITSSSFYINEVGPTREYRVNISVIENFTTTGAGGRAREREREALTPS